MISYGEKDVERHVGGFEDEGIDVPLEAQVHCHSAFHRRWLLHADDVLDHLRARPGHLIFRLDPRAPQNLSARTYLFFRVTPGTEKVDDQASQTTQRPALANYGAERVDKALVPRWRHSWKSLGEL